MGEGKKESPLDPQSEPRNEISVGNMKDVAGAAIGTGAKAVNVDAAKGDVGTVVTADSVTIIEEIAAKKRVTKWQVGRPPENYVSRGVVERRLRRVIRQPSQGSRYVALTGLPGVGLTGLARKVAGDLKPDFPDGLLWADLQTMTATDALWRFIEPYDDSLDRAGLSGLGQYAETLQRVLSDKHVLIAIDNLESTPIARDILPSGCPNVIVLLITHGQRPAFVPEGNTVLVSEMREDEAEALFRAAWQSSNRLAATSQEIIVALAKELLFMPADMVVVARDILNRQILPAEYLAELRQRRKESQSGDQEYSPGFAAVYSTLPQRGQQALPFLGVLGGGSWQLDALLSVAQMRPGDAEVALRQLLSAGLVARVSAGRFSISPVTRNFALAKLEELGGEALVRAARKLATEYYLSVGQQIVQRFRQFLLDEYLGDEERKQHFMKALFSLFEGPDNREQDSPAASLAKVQPGLANVDFVRETFEQSVLQDAEYSGRWSTILNADLLLDFRRQLEEALDWAVAQEDWALVRRFADFSSANWVVNSSFAGVETRSSANIDFDFGLVRNSTFSNYFVYSKFRASRIIASTWTECELISVSWPGVHLYESTFVQIDAVGAILPGLVVKECTFVEVDFRGADLRGAIFYDTRFVEVKFRNANLEGVEFINCSFTEVDFRKTAFEWLGDGEDLYTETVTGRIFPGDLDLDILGPTALTAGALVNVTAIESLFSPVLEAAEEAPPEKRAEAVAKAEALRQEAAKGEAADDELMAELMTRLLDLAPDAASELVDVFSSPVLSGSTGPATEFLLGALRGRSGG